MWWWEENGFFFLAVQKAKTPQIVVVIAAIRNEMYGVAFIRIFHSEKLGNLNEKSMKTRSSKKPNTKKLALIIFFGLCILMASDVANIAPHVKEISPRATSFGKVTNTPYG